jgi:carbamoyl-phosphate synthase large subunit
MNYKIGVTGAGGGVGQSIIKALQNTIYTVVAFDGELLGTGLYSVTKSYLIPYASDASYIEKLLFFCRKEQIVALFPGLDAELKVLSKNVELFKGFGIQIIVSRPEVINISDDKLALYRILSGLNINVPYTEILRKSQDMNIDFPVIVKQMKDGARSKNVYKINDKTELNDLKRKLSNQLDQYIIQEYIQGDEYTCGSIFIDNSCEGVILMKRILRDGDTYKAFAIRDKFLEEFVRDLVNKIKPFGACNIQLRTKGDVPFVFELNARCSGTTAARALCGFNEPLMILDKLLLGKSPVFQIKERTILRYWKELVVENELISQMNAESYLEIKNPTKL